MIWSVMLTPDDASSFTIGGSGLIVVRNVKVFDFVAGKAITECLLFYLLFLKVILEHAEGVGDGVGEVHLLLSLLKFVSKLHFE